jgi:hypothetical protein
MAAFLENLRLYRFSDTLPIFWRRHPQNPYFRGAGRDFFRMTDLDVNGVRDVFWRICPSASQVFIPREYWRDEFPPMSAEDEHFWISQTGIKTHDELQVHLRTIRNQAFQVIQEFTFARWWFLRSIMSMNPYYGIVIEAARNGATIIDLGCGLSQDLRRLRADGATGELHGIDCGNELWKLGSSLFNDLDAVEADGSIQFHDINIVWESVSNENPLGEFKDKADIYLLNDVLSFGKASIFHDTSKSIWLGSKIGTKVMGWMIGQVGESTGDGKEFGDGHRGYVLTMETFKQWFATTLGNDEWKDVKWEVEAQLLEFSKLGFDEVDQKWFKSDFWNGMDPANRPNELGAICFLLTQIS